MFKSKVTLLLILSLLAACSDHSPSSHYERWRGKRASTDDRLDAESNLRNSQYDTDTTLTNLSQIITELNAQKLYQRARFGSGVKIAILDNGFAGLEQSLGKRLPPNLRIESAPKNQPAESDHGTRLAEVVYAIATGSATYQANVPGPSLFLYNANGWTNAEHAFKDAKRRGVDYILYAQTWTYGGNLDGTGFINKVVSEAADAGIIVVTSAGNYAQASYQNKIKINSSRYVQLPFQQKYIRLNINEPVSDVRISLAWNDFRDDINYRTNQDLDLELYTDDLTPIAGSILIQDGKPHRDDERDYSAHAREVINMPLEKGTYYIAVKAKSNNFKSNSRFWITAYGAGATILEAGQQSNSVFVPADNPKVLTVGASDDKASSFALPQFGPSTLKPDVCSFSQIAFDNGESFSGTSAAAAITTGFLSLLHTGPYGGLTLPRIKQLINSEVVSLGTSRCAKTNQPILYFR